MYSPCDKTFYYDKDGVVGSVDKNDKDFVSSLKQTKEIAIIHCDN